jgi:PAS domain S-box-containing protein
MKTAGKPSAESANQAIDLEFCRFVIGSLPAAVVTVDSDLRITGFNPWAERITGYTSNEAMGKFCGEILQGGHCKGDCPLKQVLNRTEPVVQVETTIQDKLGETLSVRMHTAGLFDGEGKLIGGVETFVDISYVRALERERNNLISMFAHDMKSPIISIHGFAHRMGKTANNLTEAQQKYLDIIEKESTNLEALIDDFLEFSRLQTGKLKLNVSATSLDKELHEIYGIYRPRMLQKGLELVLESQEALPIIDADSARLRRVFTNLLENAIKFSKEQGTITISTDQTDKEVVVKIEDQGIGIPPEELPQIFDPFHRGSREGKEEGFGLGLAGVKAIVDEHGGRILVASEPGQGSVFSVFLPRRQALEER